MVYTKKYFKKLEHMFEKDPKKFGKLVEEIHEEWSKDTNTEKIKENIDVFLDNIISQNADQNKCIQDCMDSLFSEDIEYVNLPENDVKHLAHLNSWNGKVKCKIENEEKEIRSESWKCDIYAVRKVKYLLKELKDIALDKDTNFVNLVEESKESIMGKIKDEIAHQITIYLTFMQSGYISEIKNNNLRIFLTENVVSDYYKAIKELKLGETFSINSSIRDHAIYMDFERKDENTISRHIYNTGWASELIPENVMEDELKVLVETKDISIEEFKNREDAFKRYLSKVVKLNDLVSETPEADEELNLIYRMNDMGIEFLEKEDDGKEPILQRFQLVGNCVLKNSMQGTRKRLKNEKLFKYLKKKEIDILKSELLDKGILDERTFNQKEHENQIAVLDELYNNSIDKGSGEFANFVELYANFFNKRAINKQEEYIDTIDFDEIMKDFDTELLGSYIWESLGLLNNLKRINRLNKVVFTNKTFLEKTLEKTEIVLVQKIKNMKDEELLECFIKESDKKCIFEDLERFSVTKELKEEIEKTKERLKKNIKDISIEKIKQYIEENREQEQGFYQQISNTLMYLNVDKDGEIQKEFSQKYVKSISGLENDKKLIYILNKGHEYEMLISYLHLLNKKEALQDIKNVSESLEKAILKSDEEEIAYELMKNPENYRHIINISLLMKDEAWERNTLKLTSIIMGELRKIPYDDLFYENENALEYIYCLNTLNENPKMEYIKIDTFKEHLKDINNNLILALEYQATEEICEAMPLKKSYLCNMCYKVVEDYKKESLLKNNKTNKNSGEKPEYEKAMICVSLSIAEELCKLQNSMLEFHLSNNTELLENLYRFSRNMEDNELNDKILKLSNKIEELVVEKKEKVDTLILNNPAMYSILKIVKNQVKSSSLDSAFTQILKKMAIKMKNCPSDFLVKYIINNTDFFITLNRDARDTKIDSIKDEMKEVCRVFEKEINNLPKDKKEEIFKEQPKLKDAIRESVAYINIELKKEEKTKERPLKKGGLEI